jgi:hypothetical protein
MNQKKTKKSIKLRKLKIKIKKSNCEKKLIKLIRILKKLIGLVLVLQA